MMKKITRCKICGKTFEKRNNSHKYCKECAAIQKKKHYREASGYYLYLIKNRANKVLYVGSTTNYKNRLNNHLSYNTNIKELIKSNRWYTIQFVNITEIVKTVDEMHLLENKLIEMYDSEYNKYLNRVNISKSREYELLYELYRLNIWKIYAINEEEI